MVDIEEIQEDARKSQNQLEKVETATIPDADRDTTLAFIRHEEGSPASTLVCSFRTSTSSNFPMSARARK